MSMDNFFDQKLVMKISDRWCMIAKSSHNNKVKYKLINYKIKIILLTFFKSFSIINF